MYLYISMNVSDGVISLLLDQTQQYEDWEGS